MSFIGKKYRYSKELNKMIEVGSAEDRIEKAIGAPYVQGDEIPPTVSHATDEGLVFTSRSALRRHYKEHGFRETGGQHLQGKGLLDCRYRPNREEIVADILEAKRAIQWGEVPFSEKEKEVCQREERRYQEYRRRMGR